MLEGLHKREENIRNALDQAERTRQEAMQLQAKLDAKWKEVGAEIAAAMDKARRDAQVVMDQKVAEAKAEIQHERERLKREMDTAKDQALQEIWQQAVALASLMSTKAVRRSLTPDDHKRLLDESLAELKQAGAGFGKRHLAGAGL
jgi:F-type H+-transporting ATPase subunit b